MTAKGFRDAASTAVGADGLSNLKVLLEQIGGRCDYGAGLSGGTVVVMLVSMKA